MTGASDGTPAWGGSGSDGSGSGGSGWGNGGRDGVEVAPSIDCIDCGGEAFLLTRLDDEDPLRPGDIVSYRCRDCLDQWYLEIPDLD